jgi:hypothetical protein
MADIGRTATRSVTCPRCRAEAMLIHAVGNATPRPQSRDDIIFLCPNECALGSPQMSVLINRDS